MSQTRQCDAIYLPSNSKSRWRAEFPHGIISIRCQEKQLVLLAAPIYPSLDAMHLRIKDDQPSGEFGARIFHIVFGTLCLFAALWTLILLSPFNPYAFFILLTLGLGPLLTGLHGDRKAVLQLLFISGS